jgi:hypothetical protein
LTQKFAKQRILRSRLARRVMRRRVTAIKKKDA